MFPLRSGWWKEIELTHADTNSYVHQGTELSISGEWDFTVIVRPQVAAEWRASVTRTIQTEGSSSDEPAPAWHFPTFVGVTGLLLTVSGFSGLAWATIRSRLFHRLLIGGLAAGAIAIGISVLAVGRIDQSDAPTEHDMGEEVHEDHTD